MNENKTLLPLVAIIGPTASGKSALAVKLADRLGGEVVACDSTQLYRGFDIGTAKPTLAERHGIPHHLVDVLGPKDDATAGGYRQFALQILGELRQRKRLPVFTVGTGLYFARPPRGSCGCSPALSRIARTAPRERRRAYARPSASCPETARSGSGRKNRVRRRTEAHPRRRGLPAHKQAHLRSASNRPCSSRRLADSKSWIDAAA